MNELCDLGGGYYLKQPKGVYPCGTDAVLLAAFAAADAGGKICADLCAGSGVVAILLCKRLSDISVTALEISAAACDTARENMKLNGLDGRVKVIRGDLREADRYFAPGSCDFVTVNPPYMKVGTGKLPDNDAELTATREVCCDFADTAAAAGYILRRGGRLFVVHRPDRLGDIFKGLAASALAPVRLRFVHPTADSAARLVLIEARKGSRAAVVVEKPLVICGDDGKYTEETEMIYGGGRGK